VTQHQAGGQATLQFSGGRSELARLLNDVVGVLGKVQV
jgi:hypothetical protein